MEVDSSEQGTLRISGICYKGHPWKPQGRTITCKFDDELPSPLLLFFLRSDANVDVANVEFTFVDGDTAEIENNSKDGVLDLDFKLGKDAIVDPEFIKEVRQLLGIPPEKKIWEIAEAYYSVFFEDNKGHYSEQINDDQTFLHDAMIKIYGDVWIYAKEILNMSEYIYKSLSRRTEHNDEGN